MVPQVSRYIKMLGKCCALPRSIQPRTLYIIITTLVFLYILLSLLSFELPDFSCEGDFPVGDPPARYAWDLAIINKLGRARLDSTERNDGPTLPEFLDASSMFKDHLRGRWSSFKREFRDWTEKYGKKPVSGRRRTGETVSVALVGCRDTGREKVVMTLKSALIFSQDAHLHAFVFSDKFQIALLGFDLLELKWMADAQGWDFTFSMHATKFPKCMSLDIGEMDKPCSTQSLFISSQLPDVDSVIYLDPEMLVLSNLTEIWNLFKTKMQTPEIIIGMAPYSEYPAHSYFTQMAQVPYVEPRGIHGGVILMNLTRMREFDIDLRSLEALGNNLFGLQYVADDVHNIVFHNYSEKVYILDCTYNFRPKGAHCGGGTVQVCVGHEPGNGICFCQTAMIEGIRLINFSSTYELQFLSQLSHHMKKIHLLFDNPREVFAELARNFNHLELKPACFQLTSRALYRNAIRYLDRIH